MKTTTIRRAIACAMLCLLLAALFPVTAYADIGPKPSVQVTFENMHDHICYGTLLSKEESTGPAYVWDGQEDHISLWGDQDMEIWQAFVDYEDPDGFYFLQWFWRCDESKTLTWGYYPPETFKILLYYPDTGEFLTSEVCERYAFDSYFKIDLAQDDMTVSKGAQARRDYDYTREVAAFMARMILTVLIELAVAWLFGIRKKELLLLIVLVNVLTQVGLNAALNAAYYFKGPWGKVFWLAVLEPVIFILEALVYCLLFKRFGGGEIRKVRIVLYALAANVCSFALGLMLYKLGVGIF